MQKKMSKKEMPMKGKKQEAKKAPMKAAAKKKSCH